jgi:NAD(P)H dehydrogenase (quinone)
MAKILVTYASDYGNTEKMANAVADGVRSVAGVEVLVKKAEDVIAEDMIASDGIVFGSPVHMGSMDWRVKKLIDTVCSGLWMQNLAEGKVAGVFASGSGFGGAGGGAELTLLSMLNNIAELGMIMIPLPKSTPGYPKGGMQWGAYGRTADENLNPVGVSEDALAVARLHGANIARATVALKDKKVFGA